MKKAIITIILLISFVTPAFNQASASSPSLSLYVNNKALKGTDRPFVSKGTTYVPLYAIVKKMGTSANPTGKQVIAAAGGTCSVTVKEGDTTATFTGCRFPNGTYEKVVPLKREKRDGRTVKPKAKALYQHGKLFVPMEFISDSEGLNYDVEALEGKTKTTFHVGELPATLQQSVKKYGYMTENAYASVFPSGLKGVTSLVKYQRVYVMVSQGDWYKVKAGKQSGYVKKENIAFGTSPAKGKMYDDGWFAPVLKSKWSKDPAVNYKTLKNELGFQDDGRQFSIYGKTGIIQVISQGRTGSYEVGLTFYAWEDTKVLPQSYRVPIVAKELFKLYFEGDATRVWKYLDSGDIPDDFKAGGRKIHASVSEQTGALYLRVGSKTKK